MPEHYDACLADMASATKLPDEVFFVQAPPRPPKDGREFELVERAKKAFGQAGVYVDLSTSSARMTAAADVVPCITPGKSKEIYSTRHGRPLLPEELLRLQGLFSSCFPSDVYGQMLADGALAKDLAGNSFTSTVCQASILGSIAACPKLWKKIGEQSVSRGDGTSSSHSLAASPTSQSVVVATSNHPDKEGIHGILRRVTGKRKAPGYDAYKIEVPKSVGGGKVGRTRRRKKVSYKRKQEGVDSRKFSKGKKATITIAQKMEMLFGC